MKLEIMHQLLYIVLTFIQTHVLNTYYATDSYFIQYVLKMEYGCNLWLKVSFITCTYITKKILKSLHALKMSFLLLNLQFWQKPTFLWTKNIFLKRLFACIDFKNNFSKPLFTIIFRPNILIFDTYSILSK